MSLFSKYLFFLVFLLVPYVSYAKTPIFNDTAQPEFFYEALRLERVIDGDTFVASGKKIRLWGINAPEKNAPLYDLSTQKFKEILLSGSLRCKHIDVDKYSREVMYCISGSYDVGSIMVRKGLAKNYVRYSGGFYRIEEQFAQKNKLGIWGVSSK